MHGIHTALVTPFQPDGQIDWSAWEALLDRQIDNGIHGLVVCGTTGETPTLSADEQDQLLRSAVARHGSTHPITMGVGTNNTRTTVANLERARANGATYGLLVFPYYNKPNPRGHRLHIEEAAKVGLPLVLYHVPGRTGQRLAPELVAELAELDGVVAVKEATGDLLFGGRVLNRTGRAILSGDDFTFLPLLSLGGAGCISVVSNVDPARTVAVYDAFVAGDNATATREMRRLLPLVEFLFSDTNPTPSKAALASMGLCGPTVRLPLADYDGPGADALLAELGLK